MRNLKFLYGSNRLFFTNWAMAFPPRSYRDLAGQLLQLDDDEFRRLERSEPDLDVHHARVDVVVGGGLLVALDEVRLLRGLALEGALTEEALHEGAEVQPDLRPERLVVRLEHDPLGTAVHALLEEQRRAPDRHVLPLRGEHVRALQRARAPGDPADDGERAQAVDAERVQLAVLGVGKRH